MSNSVWISKTPNDLLEPISYLLSSREKKEIWLLSGPMGSGKTTFMRAVLSHLKCDEVASPSYALHHRYVTDQGIVDHLDLYRLESEEDLESFGFWDLFIRDDGLIAIEWPERLNKKDLPRDWRCRTLQFSGPEAGGQHKLSLQNDFLQFQQ